MSTITTLNDWITGASFRWQVNTNFANLNTDKAELSGGTFTGDISVPAEVYGAGWNWSNEVPTKNDLYDKIETLGSWSVATDSIWDAKWDLAVGTGANTASRLAIGANGTIPIADSSEVTGIRWWTPAGGWDALTSWTLAQFAATTSLQLKWVISDETGSWSLVFATSPTLVTPSLGVASATSINGASIISGTLDWSVTWTNTGDQTSIVGITGTKAQFDTAVTDWNIVYSGDSPTLGTITTTGNIELWNASDTTIAREAAGIISVENEIINGYTTTATAAGTTTLTRASAKNQVFTGTTTQTVALPTTGIILGQQYIVSNKSTGKVTVQSSGANTVYILGTGNVVTFTAQQATPTTAAHWEYTLIDGIDNDKDTTASGNAATIDLKKKKNTITNNSAATLTITLPTAGAVDGMMRMVRVLDFSAVVQTLTFVNTENSSVTVPTTSNGSTTLPKTAGFQFNGATSLWRCIASA